MSDAKWIDFIKMPEVKGRKTDVFTVINKESITDLGLISWYGHWRCYVFFPADGIVFERTCLLDIVKFIDRLMLNRKIEKQNSKQ